MTYDRVAHKRRRYLRLVGKPPLLDGPEAKWARSKVIALHARGMSYKAMARQQGLDGTHHYSNLVDRDSDRILRSTFERIRNLRFEEPVGSERGAQLDPTGTRRRLQALVADGFSTLYLAGEVRKRGVGSARGIGRIMTEPIQHVHYNLASAVVAVYDKLEAADPVEAGVGPRIVRYSRTVGQKRGYAPSHCWDPDTIDDPEAIPEWTGACGTLEGRRIHRREDIPICPPCRDVKAESDSAAPGAFSPRRFREVRKAAGYSQRRLEHALGFGEGALHHWENGRNAPRRKNLEKALSVLDATFEEVSESLEDA